MVTRSTRTTAFRPLWSASGQAKTCQPVLGAAVASAEWLAPCSLVVTLSGERLALIAKKEKEGGASNALAGDLILLARDE